MYKIVYSEGSINDIAALSKVMKKRIKSAINQKLVVDPVAFGKPLRYSLKNVRALRVGDYRITFVLNGKKVQIILIGHRSKIYKRFNKK